MGYEPFSKRWRFRMWVANLINELDKNICWARICGWATGLNEEVSIWPWHPEYPNYQGCTQEEGAYCGKCIQTGRLRDDRGKRLVKIQRPFNQNVGDIRESNRRRLALKGSDRIQNACKNKAANFKGGIVELNEFLECGKCPYLGNCLIPQYLMETK